MKKLIAGAVLFLAFCSPATAGPKEDALAVLAKWTRAFTESDVDTIVRLYAPDALFFGTGSKTLVTRTEDIRTYFEQALMSNRPRSAALGDHAVLVLSDTAVLVTGFDTVGGVRDGKPYVLVGRTTFVVERRTAGWQIVHFHRSAMPN